MCISVFFDSFNTWFKRIASRSRASFSLFWSWTNWNACCCVFCCLVTWSSSRSKPSVESQRLKMERALHAASLIGSPRMNHVAAASAATAPISCRVRLWGSSSSIERLRRVVSGDNYGGTKDSAISLKVLNSSRASLTSCWRYLYMLSICWVRVYVIRWTWCNCIRPARRDIPWVRTFDCSQEELHAHRPCWRLVVSGKERTVELGSHFRKLQRGI